MRRERERGREREIFAFNDSMNYNSYVNYVHVCNKCLKQKRNFSQGAGIVHVQSRVKKKRGYVKLIS